jgi:hypothetical protein
MEYADLVEAIVSEALRRYAPEKLSGGTDGHD